MNLSRPLSIAVIAAVYALAFVAGAVLFVYLVNLGIGLVWVLLAADIAATVLVWLAGLVFRNVSVYDPYWSVFPPVAYLLLAVYMGVWSSSQLFR